MTGGRAAGCGCLVLAGGLAVCALATLLFVSALGGLLPQQMTAEPCQARGGAGARAELSDTQRRNAELIAEVGKSMDIPARGWVVAIATAMQESRLRNIEYGDRDSVGLFQQRPSQGWGARGEILDPQYAARQFYAHLRQIEDWKGLPVTDAAQRVQRSAFPFAYEQWAGLARVVVSSLADGGFSCPDTGAEASGRTPDGDWKPEEMGPDGLTPRTRNVRQLIEERFDEHDIGGFCPGGCTQGHISGSDHYDGHAFDVMLTPYTDPERVAQGRGITRWLVANADRLGIKYVIYRDRIYQPGEGWEPYTHPSGDTSDPTLRHLDHVHVSVH